MPCPGSKIRSKGLGRGKGIGKTKGPIGIPVGKKAKKLSLITLGDITRNLKNIQGLKGRVFVVGGIVTEGGTLRDIDIVVTNRVDIIKIKKALGRHAGRAHFLFQKKAPPSPIYVIITGKRPRSPEVKKKGKIGPNEYAVPV